MYLWIMRDVWNGMGYACMQRRSGGLVLLFQKVMREQGADRDRVGSHMLPERAYVGNHDGFKHLITNRDKTLPWGHVSL